MQLSIGEDSGDSLTPVAVAGALNSGRSDPSGSSSSISSGAGGIWLHVDL
jgi:hypothetical protein